MKSPREKLAEDAVLAVKPHLQRLGGVGVLVVMVFPDEQIADSGWAPGLAEVGKRAVDARCVAFAQVIVGALGAPEPSDSTGRPS